MNPAIDIFLHEFILVYDVLCNQSVIYLFIFIIWHGVVEIEVFDVKYHLIGARGQYETIPMVFGGGQVWSGGGDWDIVCQIVDYHCDF